MTKPKANLIRRYTSISATIEMVMRRELPLLDPATWEDRNDRFYMSLYKANRGLHGLYAMCGATCSETFHHWRVFTSSADGACIELYRDALEVEIKKYEHLKAREVAYKTLQQVARLTTQSVNDLPFLKRAAFAPENEYRIIAETHEPQKPKTEIPLPMHCISKILLNPWLPQSTFESVKSVIAAIPENPRILVKRSHLLENAKWKLAGERIAGVKT